jgi:hypothetical protein
MRHLKTTFVLALAVCGLAVMATPALAHEFVASKVGKTLGKGTEEVTQEEYNITPEASKTQAFKFGHFTVQCLKTRSHGEQGTESETFTTTTKFSTCGWYPQPGDPFHTPARFSKEGLTMTFHANGFTEFIGNSELEEIEWKEHPNGEVEVLETATEIKIPGKICKIQIPAQTIPVKAVKAPGEEFTSVVYKPVEVATVSKKFPSGFQKKLVFESDLKGVKYELLGGEGEQQCEQFLGEEKKGVGTYKGNVTEEVIGGDLSHT